MANQQSGELQAIRDTPEYKQAVVFLHGFSGNRDDTWDRFPGLLGANVADWDIFTLGYATTFQPDVVGVWSADPDLPIVATMYRTQFNIAPLNRYTSLTLVAHSMGGLVVQKALVDDPAFRQRVKHVILFGTPSNGLKKAWWAKLWKRQLHNMSTDSEFIRDLRDRWSQQFDPNPHFGLMAVAGSKDQFVPPESSLEPFDSSFRYVVPGDHLTIVKPANSNAESIRLLVSALSKRSVAETETLRVAAEVPPANIAQIVEDSGNTMSEGEVVEAALALERSGNRDESIRLLERYQSLGTDVQGTLAGRMKRLWLESNQKDQAQRALNLYQYALDQALAKNDHEQIYYHAINVAFLNQVAFDRPDRAKKMGELALLHCNDAPANVWNAATRAEANLYLGHYDLAISQYSQVRNQTAESWQLASAALQASQIAIKCQDQSLLEQLEGIFTPHARDVNKIFLSYSHKDAVWMERLRTFLTPYLREAETELQLWIDKGIQPGAKWFDEIAEALKTSGVAVMLVSADFLASEFVYKHELPEIVKAAEDGQLRLLWVSIGPAAYEATAIKHFQAAHDPSKPLIGMSTYDQDQTLLNVARKIKEAALGATERFTRCAQA